MFLTGGPNSHWGYSDLSRKEQDAIGAAAQERVNRSVQIQMERPLISNWEAIRTKGEAPVFMRLSRRLKRIIALLR